SFPFASTFCTEISAQVVQDPTSPETRLPSASYTSCAPQTDWRWVSTWPTYSDVASVWARLARAQAQVIRTNTTRVQRMERQYTNFRVQSCSVPEAYNLRQF